MLVITQVAVVAAGWFFGDDRFAAAVAGSIYLPLWPFDMLGVPVFHPTGWFFAPPTALGWTFLSGLWLFVYYLLAKLVVAAVRKHTRAAQRRIEHGGRAKRFD